MANGRKRSNEATKRTVLDAEKTYAKLKESLQSALSAEKEMPIHL